VGNLGCNEKPDQLAAACLDFGQLPYSKGFQTGVISPILNALRPDDFLLINNKSRRVVNYFSGTSSSHNLRYYPDSNKLARSLIDEVAEYMSNFDVPDIRDDDLFDMFTHWLVAVKKYPPATHYWKIAPGENAWNWKACKDGDFIAIGWDKLGDVHRFNKSEFEARRDELVAEHDDWYKSGVDQVWRFAHIKEGDKIVANRGTSEVLGIGTVSGQYYFVPDTRHGHRLHVDWEDLTPRKVNESGWRRTIVELDREKFEKIFNTTDDVEKKIWWVNQGLTLNMEEEGGYLWAPAQSKSGRQIYHWDTMLEVQKDDIILHYADGGLRYVSCVLAPAEKAEDPHTVSDSDWSQEGYSIRVDYQELKPPIPLAEFSQIVSKLDISQGPLNKNGGVNQGYLFRFTPGALNIIQKCSPETVWPEFEIIRRSNWIRTYAVESVGNK